MYINYLHILYNAMYRKYLRSTYARVDFDQRIETYVSTSPAVDLPYVLWRRLASGKSSGPIARPSSGRVANAPYTWAPRVCSESLPVVPPRRTSRSSVRWALRHLRAPTALLRSEKTNTNRLFQYKSPITSGMRRNRTRLTAGAVYSITN